MHKGVFFYIFVSPRGLILKKVYKNHAEINKKKLLAV